MLFEIDNVELYFKRKRILGGIYLKAETGKVTGILGRNGSGKSSLLDIIFGNLKAKYQLIRIDHQPILKPLYQTGKVKYVPQYHFIPKGKRLEKAFQLFDVDWILFCEQFNDFKNFEKIKFGDLSSGQQKLVETYLMLKAESTMVLLDEPFNGISPLLIEAVKSLINNEKQHKIIIITDHKYKEVIDIADDLYLINNGATKKIENLIELEDYKYVNEGHL